MQNRTTGITETVFESLRIQYHVLDPGGTRSERKKWHRVFDDVHCLIFVVSLSAYDACMVEDRTAVRI